MSSKLASILLGQAESIAVLSTGKKPFGVQVECAIEPPTSIEPVTVTHGKVAQCFIADSSIDSAHFTKDHSSLVVHS